MRRILVGVDGSLGSQQALAWAVREAQVRQQAIDAVIVWQSPAEASDVLWPVDEGAIVDKASNRLQTTIEAVVGHLPPAQVDPRVIEGDPAVTLCALAAEADLLVVGSRGHGTLAGSLLGSVSSKCVHHSTIPVVVVRTHGEGEPVRSFAATGRVLVGIDGSAGSRRAMEWAVDEAERRSAKVDALWVRRDLVEDMSLELETFPSIARLDRAKVDAARDRLEQLVLHEMTKHRSVTIEPIVLQGDPGDVLCQQAADADVLVVGSRGHGTFTGLLLGSVSTKCVHHSPVPVAVVPAEG